MKRNKKSRAAGETVLTASGEMGRPVNGPQTSEVYPGMLGIEMGVPYSRRTVPPYVSGHAVPYGEEEEDYDICQ